MAVVTVQGEINSSLLGYVLAHEHILSDLRPLVVPYPEIGRMNVFNQKVILENHGLLTRNPYSVLDNAVLNEEDVQTAEVLEYKKAGGDTIVDVTTREFGRDPQFLYGLSRVTGLNIVAGCGYYLGAMHPPEVTELPVNKLADKIILELNEGMDGTNIRAGVIGEVGTSEVISPGEYKSLEAASNAQEETGCGMHIHACLWNRNGIDAMKFAVKHGAEAKKICIDHVDVVLDMGYIEGILKLGAYVEFDDFGKEFYVDRRYRNMLYTSFATDRERVMRIKELIDKGYIEQILISNDICLKTLTHKYGGWGYDHILTNILPMMIDYGITTEHANTILKINPACFLDRTR